MTFVFVYKNWQGRVRRVEISQVRDVDAVRRVLEAMLDTNVVAERPRRSDATHSHPGDRRVVARPSSVPHRGP